jgi:transposase
MEGPGGSTFRWGDWKIDPERSAKGRIIAGTPRAVEQVRTDLFLVKSQSGPGFYRVHLSAKGPDCNCGDFSTRTLPCKHIAGVRYYLEGENALSPGEQVPEKVRKAYTQNWKAYDLAQTEEIPLFEMLLRDLVEGVANPEPGSQGGRPRIPIADQLFCAVQKVYRQFSCRRVKGEFGFAVERGYLSKKRHYTVTSEVLNRADLTPILKHLITRSALPLAPLEGGFAPDSTGNTTTMFGAWREEKHREKREHVWLKAHVLAGTRTHAVAAASVTPQNGADNPQFETLIRQAAEAGLSLKEVYADKAYSARANYALAEELGFDLYVPFRSTETARVTLRRGTPEERARNHSQLWRKAFLFFQLHREDFEAKYHRRSNVESVFSAIKRKFGETLRSRNSTAQENELLAKILAYNLTVLIHEIFEHGVLPDFLSEHTVDSVKEAAAVGELEVVWENSPA